MDSHHRTFDTVNVPDCIHYIFGSCIIVIGTIGVLGNLLVLYAVYSDKKLRTAPNFFITNLAVSDFLMSASQSPVFFVSSLNKRWIFGNIGCKLYAFCGALFGITSMITLMAISIDRYWVITKPLQSISSTTTKKNTLKVIILVWLYSLAWSLPPLLGWSSYIPEGLMTSCTWDYVTNSPSNRSYTLMLCCFVFFVPLIVISYCYICMFRAVKHTTRDIEKMGGCRRKAYEAHQQTVKVEWKLAKIAFVAIVVFVLSWFPYACVTLVGWAGHGDILTPYSKTVPAVLAKASAIYNPVIYAIIHPNYRRALAKSIPCLCLCCLSCIRRKDLMLGSISDSSERTLVITRQSLGLKPKVMSSGENIPREGCCSIGRSEVVSLAQLVVPLTSVVGSSRTSGLGTHIV
uniref:Opsin 4xb n=1 Tax=Callorhinchus milii TaxID=7868 RepID=A0A4W3ICZ5_CALMI